MELEGLKRGLQHLENAGLHVENLVIDRHGMVKRFMREEHDDKNHFFDVWHVAKGNLYPFIILMFSLLWYDSTFKTKKCIGVIFII